MSQTPKSTILLPLYIFPDPGCWDPLYQAITSNPDLQFIIIVNPNSGPGSPPWWPNPDYVRDIPKLNAQANVKTVGYVRIDYGRKPIEEVFEDIKKYGEWSKDFETTGLGVEGVFFDETPNKYSEGNKAYLDAMSRRVKEQPGMLGDRTVIHNPGTAVDARLAQPGPDITTVVEQGHAEFETAEAQNWLSTSPYDRSRSCYMVHSAPETRIKDITCELRRRAEYLFVTSLRQDFYESFGPSWQNFVNAMAEP
ncbi:hypothetical protein P154DRAFT_625923 [Amniculicola lignicola CBS 123094]|uniref:Cell surface protein n=1 Tax=Amniculicola lignicola CBS 123094 TaxID=1392246 RepID=A0A6A5VXT3_9PLEO|nr:hypothetical protein P154DRAFT_625923 [Amniculicola lignicola CBS 123094]